MPENERDRRTLTAALLTALWLGAALLFAAVVAPSAFSVLPSRSLAGELVGRILPIIFVLGIVLGATVFVMEVRPPRVRHWIARATGGLMIAIACAVAQLGIAPRIARIRESASVPLDSLAAGDAVRESFGRLHAMSVGWLAVAMIAAASILVFAWLGLSQNGLSRNKQME